MKYLAAAKSGLYFHGSSMIDAEDVLAHGLLANPPKKNFYFGDEISFGGVYLTTKINTAIEYAIPSGVLVAVEIKKPEVLLADEDEFVNLHHQPEILNMIKEETGEALNAYEVLIKDLLGEVDLYKWVDRWVNKLESSVTGKPLLIPKAIINKYKKSWYNLLYTFLRYIAVKYYDDYMDGVTLKHFMDLVKERTTIKDEEELNYILGVNMDDEEVAEEFIHEVTALSKNIDLNTENVRSLEDIGFSGPNRIVAIFTLARFSDSLIDYEADDVDAMKDIINKYPILKRRTWKYAIKDEEEEVA